MTLRLWLAALTALGVGSSSLAAHWQGDGFHVFPGGNVQDALDQAARNPTNKTVKVHAGIYRPNSKRQALLWFNAAHDGIRVQAVGEVILTAANAQLSDPNSPSHPAVVNHVVYFGDGISPRTVLEGFRITGANHFVTTQPPEIEPNRTFKKDLFFYADGGAVKIFGRSFPTLRTLEIVDNYASPCAGGVSVQHQGHGQGASPGAVLLEHCIFRNNRAQVTGAALDLLPGSSAVVSHCLFVGNAANTGENSIASNKAAPEFTNSAALTVFPGSRVLAKHCTFTGNRNAVDDLGQQSVYENCVFWRNDLGGGFYAGDRYELDIQGRARVAGCSFGGPVLDPNGCISKTNNVMNAPNPRFDVKFRPQSDEYHNAGFRPFKD